MDTFLENRSGALSGRRRYPRDEDGAADAARGRLVDLSRFVATAGDAAIRLPVHLMPEEHADLLLEHFEDRTDYHRPRSEEDAFEPSAMSERETAVIRSVLFQIKDAVRLREVVAA